MQTGSVHVCGAVAPAGGVSQNRCWVSLIAVEVPLVTLSTDSSGMPG